MSPPEIFATVFIFAVFVLHRLTGSLLQPNDDKTSGDEDGKACHNRYPRRMEHLAMKTPYLPEPNEVIIPTGCYAKQFWLLNRHGARYPGDEDIQEMLSALPGLRDEIVKAFTASKGMLCESEIEPFKNWTSDPGMDVSKENFLVDQGYKELEGIGARYAERFPGLFPKNFSNETYYLRTSVEQRAIESGKAFAKGVFGSTDDVYFPEPMKGDPVLHFYKGCAKYKAQVKNPESSKEYDRFLQSTEFLNVLENVQSRLGLDRNLTSIEILLMYKTCAFELAWNPQASNSPWCTPFDASDFSVLEYREDLEDYWKDGYGFPITYEQACKPVVDVVERFSATVDGNETESTVGYFAHHGTLLKVYGRLGLFKDAKNLTADSFEEFKDTREWKNGKIGKFASNIAFVLFHCPDEESSPYQVATLVQEKPTPLPACDDQWICPFERFMENLQPIVETCDLDEICQV